MKEPYFEKIASECSLRPVQVKAVSDLLEDGATIPFIARYRKEATGSLDEVMVTTIRDRLSRLRELDERRMAILTSLEEQNVLSDELRTRVEAGVCGGNTATKDQRSQVCTNWTNYDG